MVWQEARNSRLFYDSMQGQNIITRSIVVPRVGQASRAEQAGRARLMGACAAVLCVVLQVYDSLTSRGVLVSEWIEGRKLSSLNRNDKVGREGGTRL